MFDKLTQGVPDFFGCVFLIYPRIVSREARLKLTNWFPRVLKLVFDPIEFLGDTRRARSMRGTLSKMGRRRRKIGRALVIVGFFGGFFFFTA